MHLSMSKQSRLNVYATANGMLRLLGEFVIETEKQRRTRFDKG